MSLQNDLYWLNAHAGDPTHVYPTGGRNPFVLAADNQPHNHCALCGAVLVSGACAYCGCGADSETVRIAAGPGKRRMRREWNHTSE